MKRQWIAPTIKGTRLRFAALLCRLRQWIALTTKETRLPTCRRSTTRHCPRRRAIQGLCLVPEPCVMVRQSRLLNVRDAENATKSTSLVTPPSRGMTFWGAGYDILVGEGWRSCALHNGPAERARNVRARFLPICHCPRRRTIQGLCLVPEPCVMVRQSAPETSAHVFYQHVIVREGGQSRDFALFQSLASWSGRARC